MRVAAYERHVAGSRGQGWMRVFECGWAMESWTISGAAAFDVRDPTSSAGPTLVEAEFIPLDVLHHQARLILLIGGQQTQAPSAERFQPSRLGLERSDSLVTRQPHPDSNVEM